MFSRLNLIDRFNIDLDKLRSLVSGLSRHMKRVPYHNFTHAFNIVHMTYIILIQSKLRTILDDVDVLAAIVGALAHDTGHPGLNNVYFQKVRHPMAQTCNDQAVLEMYHGYLLQWLLSKPENDILIGLTAQEKTRFRKATLEAILGTDMTKHFMLCQ